MHKKQKVIAGVVLVVVAGASFWGGTQYQASQPRGAAGFGAGMQYGGVGGQGGSFAARGSTRSGGGGMTVGQIVSAETGSITVGMQSGGSKTIYLSDSTQILKTASGTQADLAKGTTVVVNGTQNQDGSVTAQSVQIRPTAPERTVQQAQ